MCKYDPKSGKAEELSMIRKSGILWHMRMPTKIQRLILSIIEKARDLKGLSHREASVLLACEDKELLKKTYMIWLWKLKKTSTETVLLCLHPFILQTTV